MAPRPRGRPRKKVKLKIAAAIDAMKPFGFPNNLVVKTIEELEEVYGEDGWLFIEDSSYKVLLEAILEKVSGQGTSDSKQPVAETEADKPFDLSGSDVKTGALPTSNSLDFASMANQASCTEKLTSESVTLEPRSLPSFEPGGSSTSHVHQPCSTTSQPTPPLGQNPPMVLPGTGLTTRMRRPHFGWIGGTDEEEDLVVLRPGEWAVEAENWLSSSRSREHKTRWDVKPEDV